MPFWLSTDDISSLIFKKVQNKQKTEMWDTVKKYKDMSHGKLKNKDCLSAEGGIKFEMMDMSKAWQYEGIVA